MLVLLRIMVPSSGGACSFTPSYDQGGTEVCFAEFQGCNQCDI